MKTSKVCSRIPAILSTILILAFSFTSMAAGSEGSDYYIRIDLAPGVKALTELKGNLTMSFGEAMAIIPIALEAGKDLEASHSFPGAQRGQWSIELICNGLTVLSLQGEVNDTSVRFRQSFYDENIFQVQENMSSVLVSIGFISANMSISAKMREQSKWTIVTAFDANANGAFEANESNQIEVQGTTINISSPIIAVVPPTSKFSLSVLSGEKTVINITGDYDYVLGKGIDVKSWSDDGVVESYIARLSYTPRMAVIKLSNKELVHKFVTQPLATQETYEAIVGGGTFKQGDAKKEIASNVTLERESTLLNGLEELKLLIMKYWPIITVASIVLVGLALAIRHRRRQ